MTHIKLFENWLNESASKIYPVETIKVTGTGESFWVTNTDYEDLVGNQSYTLSAKNVKFYKAEGIASKVKPELIKVLMENMEIEENTDDFKYLDDAVVQLEPKDLRKNEGKSYLIVFYDDMDRDITDYHTYLIDSATLPTEEAVVEMLAPMDEEFDLESMEIEIFSIN